MKRLLVVLILSMMSFNICQAQTEAEKLFNKAQDLENTSDYEGAVDYYLQAWQHHQNDGSDKTEQAAQCLHNLGRAYSNLDNVSDARYYEGKALELRKTLFGEISDSYITTLNNYAYTYYMSEDYSEAIKLQTKVLQLCDQLSTQHQQLFLFYINMGRFCYAVDDFDNTTKYWENAIILVEKYGDAYEFLLERLYYLYEKLNDKENVLRIMKLGDEHNKHELEKDCNEPDCLLERAQYYSNLGDVAKAKEIYLSILSMNLDDKTKIVVFETYAGFNHFFLEDNVNAANYLDKSATLRLKVDGENEIYAKTMYKSALFHYFAGEFHQSINNYFVAIDCFESLNNEQYEKNIIDCKEGLGNSYSSMKDYENAYRVFDEIINYYKENDINSVDYPKAIVQAANQLKYQTEYDLSIKYYKQALDIYEKMGLKEDYISTANSLNLCYYYAGKDERVQVDNNELKSELNKKLDKIIESEVGDLELTRNFLGKLVYARSLATIAGCYSLKEEYATSVTYYKKYMEAVREAIRDRFRMLHEGDRMNIWEEEKVNLESILSLLVTLPVGNESLMNDLSMLAYDVELLSKGILLNSSIEFEETLRTNSNPTLLGLYKEALNNEIEIQRLREIAVTDEDLDKISELTKTNELLQLKLYKECAEFADYTNYMSYTWEDVKSSLSDKDVAIEFSAIRHSGFDEDDYMAALVITKDLPQPVALPICNLSLANMMVNDTTLFSTPLVGNIVWGFLEQYIQDKRRIFFSADGVFNQIGIEYLMYKDTPLSEQFEVYRLSSTKELCYQRKNQTISNIALFGDIDYNSKSETGSSSEMLSSISSGEIKRESGAGFINLENTYREIQGIKDVFKGNDSRSVVEIYSGNKASEQAFNGLSDKDFSIIHIATHGIYLEEEQASESETMTNCKLAFAGANLGSDASGDGLISATQIAEMNLRSCDLAVLSACETGLGKLGDDGVFGLQRGFKNAGVKSLLMSLKKVYDDATADLMIHFYDNLIVKGMTKREALVQAQKEMRESCYSDPKYWTTFILLDAM